MRKENKIGDPLGKFDSKLTVKLLISNVICNQEHKHTLCNTYSVPVQARTLQIETRSTRGGTSRIILSPCRHPC